MDLVSTILIAVLVAALSPICVFVSSSWVERGKRRRAFARLVKEPLVFVGAKIEKIERGNSSQPIARECEITKMEVGRIEILLEGGKEKMSFTGQEFETFQISFLVNEE